MSDLNGPIFKMELHLIIIESVNLNINMLLHLFYQATLSDQLTSPCKSIRSFRQAVSTL